MQEHAEGPRSKPPLICHHCGAINPPEATLCSKCETALRGPEASAEKSR